MQELSYSAQEQNQMEPENKTNVNYDKFYDDDDHNAECDMNVYKKATHNDESCSLF